MNIYILICWHIDIYIYIDTHAMSQCSNDIGIRRCLARVQVRGNCASVEMNSMKDNGALILFLLTCTTNELERERENIYLVPLFNMRLMRSWYRIPPIPPTWQCPSFLVPSFITSSNPGIWMSKFRQPSLSNDVEWWLTVSVAILNVRFIFILICLSSVDVVIVPFVTYKCTPAPSKKQKRCYDFATLQHIICGRR